MPFAILMVACLCAAAGCGRKASLRVGVLYSWALGDRGFNDLVHTGLVHQRDARRIRYDYMESAKVVDNVGALRSLAGRCGLVVANGFRFSEEILLVAREYPAVRFVCMDFQGRPGVPIMDNLLGIRFREEEGAYLAGALAGLMTRSGTVGFVGGMRAPLIRKFEAGFEAGARRTRSGVRVLSSYAGDTVEAFRNPGKGRELAEAISQQGADIILHAAGNTGLGVIDAARRTGRWVIGANRDQWDEGLDPATGKSAVLTSMLKHVDRAVEDQVTACLDGRFRGGRVLELGLAEDGVGLVMDARNRPVIPEPVIRRVNELRQAIIDGRVRVPTR